MPTIEHVVVVVKGDFQAPPRLTVPGFVPA
jgi:hypothetical protein